MDGDIAVNLRHILWTGLRFFHLIFRSRESRQFLSFQLFCSTFITPKRVWWFSPAKSSSQDIFCIGVWSGLTVVDFEVFHRWNSIFLFFTRLLLRFFANISFYYVSFTGKQMWKVVQSPSGHVLRGGDQLDGGGGRRLHALDGAFRPRGNDTVLTPRHARTNKDAHAHKMFTKWRMNCYWNNNFVCFFK